MRKAELSLQLTAAMGHDRTKKDEEAPSECGTEEDMLRTEVGRWIPFLPFGRPTEL